MARVLRLDHTIPGLYIYTIKTRTNTGWIVIISNYTRIRSTGVINTVDHNTIRSHEIRNCTIIPATDRLNIAMRVKVGHICDVFESTRVVPIVGNHATSVPHFFGASLPIRRTMSSNIVLLIQIEFSYSHMVTG